MAYLAFQDLGGAGASRLAQVATSPHDPVVAGADRLSPLEWLVVAIARQDGLASLRRPGRLASALLGVFRRPNPRLADDRLEALRRTAVLMWQAGGGVSPHERRRLLAAGFTPGQYDALAASVGVALSGAGTTREHGRAVTA